MLRYRGSRFSGVVAVLLLACVSAEAHYVNDVRVAPELPVQGEPLTLTVVGAFSDGCEREIPSSTAWVADHKITVRIEVMALGGPACPGVITPFERSVELAGLASGYYRVDVELHLHEWEDGIESFPDAGEVFVHAGRTRYQLLPGSWWMDDCPVCDRIPVQLPMTGTFDLLLIGPGAVFIFYAVGDARLSADGYDIAGAGGYQVMFPELGDTRYMRLEVAVNNESGVALSSDMPSENANVKFPDIDIELAEETQSITRVYRARILARPIGPGADFDQDGDVDLTDVAFFQNCATGPELAPTPFECAAADLDRDGDADQADYGILQGCYSGDAPADPACER